MENIDTIVYQMLCFVFVRVKNSKTRICRNELDMTRSGFCFVKNSRNTLTALRTLV